MRPLSHDKVLKPKPIGRLTHTHTQTHTHTHTYTHTRARARVRARTHTQVLSFAMAAHPRLGGNIFSEVLYLVTVYRTYTVYLLRGHAFEKRSRKILFAWEIFIYIGNILVYFLTENELEKRYWKLLFAWEIIIYIGNIPVYFL